MANLHIRSNSLPSKSHLLVNDIEDHLQRLKSSEGTSTSATSVCANLAGLRDVHEGINDLIQLPSIQQALTAQGSENWTNELLEKSLGPVDLCGFAREVLSLTKGSVRELQSSIRRNRGEAATADDISVYMASRKKIIKMVNKFIKNFKGFNKNSAPYLDGDSDLKAVAVMLKDAEAFDFSLLKSVLILLSGEKGRSKKKSWSLVSKFTQTSQVNSVKDQKCNGKDLCLLKFHKSGKSVGAADVWNVLDQLKSSEVTVQELEERLEAFYRTLVKTRVSLLNALSH